MTALRDGALIKATLDHAMSARVVRQVPLTYRAGADPLVDRPPYVRAGSGLAWVGDRLAVVQDDANFVALADVENGKCDVIELPAGEGGLRQFDDARGNKQYKHDFEALLSIGAGPSQLIAFGSGSSPKRESVLLISNPATSPTVRVVPASKLYAELRAVTEFSGSELNIEGAALVGENIRLFGRGNGAPRGDLLPVNATCDINCAELLAHLEHPTRVRPPAPGNIVQYELGDIAGVPLSFTDAVGVGNCIVYVAAAEDSPDAVRDGLVAGSAVGVIAERDGHIVARFTHVTTSDSAIARVKVEGVAMGRRPAQLFAVLDRDDHDQPSKLLEIELSGFALHRAAAQP